MPGSESAILDPLQNILRWGLTGLGIVSLFAAVGVLLRRLVHWWKARAEVLARQMDRGLVSLHHALGELRSEAAAYPLDIPAPYGPIVQRLQTAIAGIEATYQTLTDQVTQLNCHPLELPEHAWVRIGYWFWHEPRYWWCQRAAMGKLIGQLDAPRAEAATANAMLRDLRKQPLDTANRARELYELVDTTQHTAGLLKTEGVHGAPLELAIEALKTYRRTLTALPIYLFACTDSQIVRRAQPAEIAAAWGTVDALDAEIRMTTDRIAAWYTAYTLAAQELQTMCACVKAATDCIQGIPEAIDISELAATWHQTRAEATALVACYEAPTTGSLDCIDQITQITQTANQMITHAASLEALHAALESNLAENADMLGQIDQQLRQLSGAARYPLDRVPMQVVLDQLTQQAAAINGTRPTGTNGAEGKRTRSCKPDQMEADLAAAQGLKQQILALVARIAEAREQRRRLIVLLDRQAESPQVDWMGWAGDLYQRILPYAEANWSSENGSSARGLGKSNGGSQTSITGDLRVRMIVHDATQLAERRTLWLPHINEPLVPDELEKRTAELTALFFDTEIFQDRLDKITQRFQLCQRIEEKAKSDLATVYGAADRLDIIAADILSPALSNENNHWTQLREQLDLGYEIELVLGNPGIGTVRDKAQRVENWIAETHGILCDWQQTLERETDAAVATLADELDALTAVAPLDGEAAVEQAREVAENLAGQSPTRRWPAARHRTTGTNDNVADLTAHLSGEIADQLRTLACADQALATLTTEVIEPLTTPIRIWREAEQTAGSALDALQKLEIESTHLWPPVSCDTASVKAEFDHADRIRDGLYQDGRTVTQVLKTIATSTETYTAICTMVEQRENTYHTQRPILDDTLDHMEAWCAALERYRDQNAGNPAIAAAIRARLDEIEAGWTQLQVRYDQAPNLIPGEEAQRTLHDLWHQARRELPLGPHMDVIAPEMVETQARTFRR